MLTWQSHTTHGRDELAGPYNTWKVLVGSWTTNCFLTRGLFVANGMATCGPINGRHMSPWLWFKIYVVSRTQPHDLRVGEEPWEGPPNRCAHIWFLICIWVSIYLNCNVLIWGAWSRKELSPSPRSYMFSM
jgi:hypothetical protein